MSAPEWQTWRRSLVVRARRRAALQVNCRLGKEPPGAGSLEAERLAPGVHGKSEGGGTGETRERGRDVLWQNAEAPRPSSSFQCKMTLSYNLFGDYSSELGARNRGIIRQ